MDSLYNHWKQNYRKYPLYCQRDRRTAWRSPYTKIQTEEVVDRAKVLEAKLDGILNDLRYTTHIVINQF